jgi:hypothetical protein
VLVENHVTEIKLSQNALRGRSRSPEPRHPPPLNIPRSPFRTPLPQACFLCPSDQAFRRSPD